jgi:hypothetical protein
VKRAGKTIAFAASGSTHRKTLAIRTLPVILAIAPGTAFACSSCGCALASEWFTQGGESGVHADFRFDYFNQDDLRTGAKRVDRGGISLPAEREIQRETVNRNYNLFLDYASEDDWGVSAQVPYFNRYHTTVAEGDEELSTSHTKSIGDVRVLARYRGLAPDRNVGVQLGLKLPTGRFRSGFIEGPQAGQALDRGLQPGTGTTDVLVGAYAFGTAGQDWGYFAEAMLQQPLDSRGDFRPGAGLNLTLGARYMGFEQVTPQVQLNVRSERREAGGNGDIENSGATLVYLSPGLSVSLTTTASAYAYVQVPVYQRVNGFQIEPRYSVSIGIRFALQAPGVSLHLR